MLHAPLLLATLALAALVPLPAQAVERGAKPERPDVIVWIESGLRADRLGSPASPLPRLEALAARGLVSTRCLAPAPEAAAALASVLSGVHPRVHGLWTGARGEEDPQPPRLADSVPALAQAFREGGYYTVCVADGGVLLDNRGLEKGFEHFESSYRLAHDRAERALEFLEARKRDRPYLFVLQTNQLVPPWFVAPAELEGRVDASYRGPLRGAAQRAWGRNGPVFVSSVRNPMGALYRQHWQPVLERPLDAADLRFAEALYDACARATDRELERVLAYLEKRGEAERTLVVVLGDRGLALGREAPLGSESLVEGALAVPLVLCGPGIAPGRIEGWTQTVDLAPTLLAYCGLPVPPTFQGRDLLAVAGEAAEQPAFAEIPGEGATLLVRTARGKALLDPTRLAAQDEPSADPERAAFEAAARLFLERCAATRAALGL